MLLLMLVVTFDMLRRRIQHTNGMFWQYFFRVQNESLQLSRTAWVQIFSGNYILELTEKHVSLFALDIQRKDTNFKEAVPVGKRVAASI